MGSGSKGSGKKSVGSLTRRHATLDEVEAMLKSAQIDLSPIACAVLMAAMVEQSLEVLLRQKLARKDDRTWALLTDTPSVLDSFHRKIDLGYALKLFDWEFRANLLTLKAIRNAFAHAKMLIDFDNEVVVEQVKQTTYPQPNFKSRTKVVKAVKAGAASQPRRAFMSLVTMIYEGLTLHWLRGQKISATKRTLTATKARAFILGEHLRWSGRRKGLGHLTEADLARYQTWSQGQNPDSKSPTPKENSGSLLPAARDADDSKDT